MSEFCLTDPYSTDARAFFRGVAWALGAMKARTEVQMKVKT